MNGLAVGLMSGTSADGIDAALVAIEEDEEGERPSLSLVRFAYEPFEPELRSRILRLCEADASLVRAGDMHVLLGRRFGRAVATLLRAAGVAPEAVRVVGSHGQTVAHYPHGGPGGDTPFTWQLGDPSSIAEACGVPVVSDFRSHDLALGGEGAPLVPYVDHALFQRADESRVLLNLGGIANITVLEAGRGPEAVCAFDTGPGNMVLDAAAGLLSDGRLGRDTDGAWAGAGRVDAALVTRWLAHPYFARPAPKSTGREEFGLAYTRERLAEARAQGLPDADAMATLTALVAQSVAQGVQGVLGDEPFALIAAGGGIYNHTLMRLLAARLRLLRPWQTSEAYGVPPDAKEAMAFAYLAWQFLAGRPTSLPSVTGARQAAVLGSLTPAGGRPARPPA